MCIRLATYEDQAEAEFLTSIFKSRSGELENTTFAILTPDGTKKLTRAARSPDHVFGHPDRMAKALNQIAKKFETPNSKISADQRTLPLMKNVSIALNVASADQLPLAILFGSENPQINELESRLGELIYDDDLAGQFVLVKTSNRKELTDHEIETATEGLYLVHPGKYGVQGEVVEAINVGATLDSLRDSLMTVAQNMPRFKKNHRSHVRSGLRLGIEWESEIPETDPQAVRVRQRARGGR